MAVCCGWSPTSFFLPRLTITIIIIIIITPNHQPPHFKIITIHHSFAPWLRRLSVHDGRWLVGNMIFKYFSLSSLVLKGKQQFSYSSIIDHILRRTFSHPVYYLATVLFFVYAHNHEALSSIRNYCSLDASHTCSRTNLYILRSARHK